MGAFYEAINDNDNEKNGMVDIPCRETTVNPDTEKNAADILNHISDAFLAMDDDMVITCFNRAAELILGKPAGEVIGQQLPVVFPEIRGSVFETRFKEAIQSGRPVIFEACLENASYRHWYEVRVHPLPKAGIAVQFLIITGRRQAQETIGRQEAELLVTLYSIGDAVIATDVRGRVLRMNPAAEQLTGWTEAEADGRPLETVMNIINQQTRHPEPGPAAQLLHDPEASTHSDHVLLISKSGREIPVAVTASAIKDQKDTITGLVLTVRDCSRENLARRYYETRLSLIEFAADHTLDELLTRALDEVAAFVDSPIGFYHFVDPDQKTLSLQQWSSRTLKEFCRAMGKGSHYPVDRAGVWVDCVHRKEPVVHNDYASLTHKKGLPPGHADIIRELVVPVMRAGRVVAILGVGNKPSPYTEADVEIVSYLADVTWQMVRQKKDEEALRESEENQRLTLSAIGDAVIATDVDGCVTRMNPVAEKLTGWMTAEAHGRPLPEIFRIINAHTRETSLNPVVKALTTGRIVGLANHTILIARDGTEFQIADSCSPIRDDKGDITGVVLVFRDVTAEYIAAEALRASERQKDMVLNATAEMVAYYDMDLRVIWANRAAAASVGQSPEALIGRLCYQIWHQSDRPCADCPVLKAIETNNTQQQERQTPDGRHWLLRGYPVPDDQGRLIGAVEFGMDITAQKQAEADKARLEEQINQSMRLESIGRLAGGVAHDLNNLLSPILGYGELLLENADTVLIRESLEQIMDAGHRARDLVRQLLAFGRRQTLEIKPVDVNGLLNAFTKLLRRTIREDIRIHLHLDPSLPTIKGDSRQLEQVLMGLAINAQDAMTDGGDLAIQTTVVDPVDGDVLPFESSQPGPYVMLTIRDTGHGMDEATLARIFEPFFSTREFAYGSGLGLSTVYGIIKQHGGDIRVDSRPEAGTTFCIYLPVTPQLSPIKHERPLPASSTADLRGSETVLVVEDNRQVRTLAEEILQERGYTVISAADGEEALAMLENQDGPIDLLLSDVVMPVMNGRQLFEAISKKYPDIRVLYMSGYPDEVIARKGIIPTEVNFIEKPFSVKALSARVRGILDQ